MDNFIGKSLGRYEIRQLLGEGGMASVFLAFDARLEREVAIKVIQTGLQGRQQFLTRFEREAKALAGLTHANIVHVIDYGDQDGVPYLVMDYLPGGTLTDRLSSPLPYDEAARLLSPIARALHYAHQKGIVHRDVKPANILFTASDDPVLSDFGIVKLLETSGGAMTMTRGWAGTPEYMAPEQWLGQVQPASDQYALGVVFYEMITGTRPYEADTPAALLLKLDKDPLPDPRQRVPELPDEVMAVMLRALAKTPEQRFADMGEFARALEKLGRGVMTRPAEKTPEPDLARPQPPAELNKLPEWLAVAGYQPERDRPQTPAPTPGPAIPQPHQERAATTPDQTHVHATPEFRDYTPVEEPAPVKKTRPRFWFAAIILGVITLVTILGLAGVFNPPIQTPTPEVPAVAPQANAAPTATEAPAPTATEVPAPTSTVFSPALNLTPLPLVNDKITVDNASQVRELARRGKGEPRQLKFSPDGKKLAVATSLGVYLYDASSREEIRFLPTGSWITNIDFSPDANLLAGGLYDSTVLLWQVSDGRLLQTLKSEEGGNNNVLFSPDGTLLATGSQTIQLWNVSDGKKVRAFNNICNGSNLVFTPDGLWLVTGTQDDSIQFWGVSDGAPGQRIVAVNYSVRSIAISPDGAWIATSSGIDNIVRLYRARDGSFERRLEGHSRYVETLAFTGDSQQVISSSYDGTIRYWQISDGKQGNTLDGAPFSAYFPGNATVPEQLAVIVANNDIHLWQYPSPLHSPEIITGFSSRIDTITLSPDGNTMASISPENTIQLLQASDGSLFYTIGGGQVLFSEIAFSPDNRLLASTDRDGTITLWDVKTGDRIWKNSELQDSINSITFSPDGNSLVTASRDYVIRLWNISDGYILKDISRGESPDSSAYFSMDKQYLISTDNKKRIKAWRTSDWEDIYAFDLDQKILGFASLPDSRWIAVSLEDGTIRLLNTTNLTEAKRLKTQAGPATYLSVSPDGNLLASIHGNDLYIWNVVYGTLITSLKSHNFIPTQVLFSPDQKLIYTSSLDGTIRLWGVLP